MSTETFESWIGREEVRSDQLHTSTVASLAATLNVEWPLKPGEALPPGWQWLFFNPIVSRSELGIDGHPARGGFLPPIELPRRMWAGSRIRYLADLPVGANASKRSRILKIEQKSGKRGSLCFVTVEHTIRHGEIDCIVEEQDIVYRDATPSGSPPPPTPERYAGEPQWGRDEQADTILLFRYSALTFNGHRIHYDLAYARNGEGYPGLVVHGPLTATLLQAFAVEHGGNRKLTGFDFRGIAPLFVDRPFRLEGREKDADTLEVWARGHDGELAMSAIASFR